MIAPASITNRTSRRARLAAAHGALLAIALAAACSSPLQTRTGEAFVTTPDGAPVAGAIVRADPIDPHHPLNIADYFRDEPSSLGSWRTDAQGRAVITLLRDRPTAISFAAADCTPDSMLIDPSCPTPLRLILNPVAPAVSKSR